MEGEHGYIDDPVYEGAQEALDAEIDRISDEDRNHQWVVD